MSNEAHVRIDEGIKRPLKREMRQDARRRPRTTQGTFSPIYTPERRAQIILGVPDAIRNGITTTQYAKQQNIPASTLKSWIIGSDIIEAARGEFLALELMLQVEAIDTAQDPLSLARAREGFRAWSWIAERREARLYGQKQEITHTVKPVLIINTSPLPVSLPQQIEDAALLPPISPTPEPSDAA